LSSLFFDLSSLAKRGICFCRAITGDTALRLAHFFGTTPEFWLNLQSLYEIRLAQQKSGKSIKTLPTLRRRLATVFHHPERGRA
jgi:plasmid maintenance system antidote protein VapI